MVPLFPLVYAQYHSHKRATKSRKPLHLKSGRALLPNCNASAEKLAPEGIPLQLIHKAHLLLIGADHPHLLAPIEPVHLGPPGGPAAIQTRLG